MAEGMKASMQAEGNSEKVKDPKATSETEETSSNSSKPSPQAALSDETQAAEQIPGDIQSSYAAGIPEADPAPLQQAPVNTMDPATPLETILHLEPPADPPPSDLNIPHMHAPPYVHHFDSYTLVKQVEEGGFTAGQSVTAMKAVRGLLAFNLDIAKEGLVSKYDVENVSFWI